MLIPSPPCFGDGYLNLAGLRSTGQPCGDGALPRSGGAKPRHHTTARAAVPTRVFLFSADREAVDADRGRGYAATEFQVAAYFGDIAEHVFEIAGYCDFFDGIGQFAVDDPHAGGSAGVISGY